MNAIRLVWLAAVVLASAVGFGFISREPEPNGDDGQPPAPVQPKPEIVLSPAVREVLQAYERDAAEAQEKIETEVGKLADKATGQLKALQDKYCKERKLDEAQAIRERIRTLKTNPNGVKGDNLPPAAAAILETFEKDAAAVRSKTEAKVKGTRDQAVEQLKLLQDKFCDEAKLDEALVVRDQIRAVQSGIFKTQPDPGYLRAQANDVGKVFYFDVTGNIQGSTWGTDVYTSDSHLATTAVHAGVLQAGQRGVVKVTILPGAVIYAGTTRNGVTSGDWGQWEVSFKVERVYGAAKPAPKEAP